MTRIGRKENVLYIVFNNNTTSEKDGLTVSVDAKADEKAVGTAIGTLKNNALAKYFSGGMVDKGNEARAIDPATEAKRIYAGLKTAAEVKKLVPPAVKPKAKVPAVQAAPAPAAPKEKPKEAVKPPPVMKLQINAPWVSQQLRNAQSGSPGADRAAEGLYANGKEVDNFLGPSGPAQKGRTQNQAKATVDVFNMLNRSDRFGAYLLAAESNPIFDYTPLLNYVSRSGGGLTASAGDAVIGPADRFIRDYVFNYLPITSGSYPGLRDDYRNAGIGTKVEMIDSLNAKIKVLEDMKKYSVADSARKLIRQQLEGPMDGTTMLATVLSVRREQGVQQAWKPPQAQAVPEAREQEKAPVSAPQKAPAQPKLEAEPAPEPRSKRIPIKL